ncbi:MAG TPA: HEAT repeat domain-containing protein [Candidatus Limnocylindrales bacterium]
MTALMRGAGVRAGEGRILLLVALLFGALEAGRGFGEVGLDTLVVSRLGTGTLPYLYVALGATSLVAALAYGAALGRVARTPLLAGILLGSAALLVAGRLVVAGGLDGIVPLIWLLTYASGTIAGTISWTVAGSVFDARQAKRLFPLCIGAAIAGSFLGTLASGPVARAAGTELLIVIEAALLGIVAILIVSIGRSGRMRVPTRRQAGSVTADLRIGFDEVVRSPLFRLIAVAYILFSVLFFSVTYPFLQAASAAFPKEADLATALGLISSAVTATSFLVSLLLANRVYARFGVATAALVLPVVYVAGFGLWLVQYSFATAALFRFTQQVAQRGLSNAIWSAFYNVVPSARRAQVLAFVDGVPGQVGMMLSGLLLLGVGRLFALDQVFWLGAGTAIVLTVVVAGIRRRYGASLVRTLRSGLGEQVLEGGPGLDALGSDPQVSAALIVASRAPEASVRRMAVTLLARLTGSEARAALTTALDDADPGVRVAAIDALASLDRVGTDPAGPGPAPTLGDRLAVRLDDPDERVRAAAVRALGRLAGESGAIRLEALAGDPSLDVRAAVAVALDDADGGVRRRVAGLLADPSPDVRQATVEAVAAVGGLAHGETIAPILIGALDDDSLRVRRTAANLLARRTADTDGVVDVLRAGSPRAQDAALLALVGHAEPARAELIAWAEAQLERAAALRASRNALDGMPGGPSTAPDTAGAFLTALLLAREGQMTNRALGALAVLGAPEARGVIRRCLHSDDPEVRAQALEALDSMGDRRLGRAIVRLLDAEVAGRSMARDLVLHELGDDDDPWVRVLARRIQAEAGGTTDMPESGRTASELDIMLTLRRVPLFEQLDPEDLQRIAATCLERQYPADTALVREGDIGDELIVIVEGSVRVVHAEPDGSERLIRRYGAGDHIGELAVLRERPRAATVIAEEGGVRAQVINGESLKAILRERPEAAMAMLATLAERISAQ